MTIDDYSDATLDDAREDVARISNTAAASRIRDILDGSGQLIVELTKNSDLGREDVYRAVEHAEDLQIDPQYGMVYPDVEVSQ